MVETETRWRLWMNDYGAFGPFQITAEFVT